MRKITTLLMLFCMFVGTAWAQADYEEIVGVKEVPTTALDFSSQDLATGYYLIKQTNQACTNKGFLKAANEAAGAVVTATSVDPTPNATNEATYVWYVEVGDAGKFSIATANKKAAWQAPDRGQKDLVAYASKAATLELNHTFESLNQTTQTLVKAANAATTFDGGYFYVHESGGNLGSWDDHNTKSLLYLEFYPVSLEQLVLKDTRFPELTTNSETPILYSIKNVRGNAYAEYNGASKSIQLHPSVRNVGGLFYFTAGATAGTYKIHNYATTNKCAGVNSWTADGIDWYIKASSNKNYNGLFISKTESASTDNDAWNDFQNNHTSVAWYNGGDAGSVWKFEKFTGNVSDFDIKMSTESEKHLYFFKNDRSNKYATYVNAGVTFRQVSATDLGSYWYFVEKTDAQDVPNGYKACYIYNAANNLPVENPGSGNMTALDAQPYPAKVYYVGYYEHDFWGQVMYFKDGDNGYGWNDKDGTTIVNYDYKDAGTIWSIIPADKTATQLTQEATTAKNNALTLIANAEEADFYTYTDEAIVTAKAAVEAVDVTTLDGAVGSLLNATVNNAVTTLTATDKGTTGPVAGQYIQLKNKQYGKYLKPNDNGGLGGDANGSDRGTLWLVEEGTDGNVKLKHVATEKYLGEIRQGTKVTMVEVDNAKQFAFTNQADCYAVFHETSGGEYAYGHIDGQNVLVGWKTNANATHWVVSEYTHNESLSDLQEIYNVVDNAFGTEPGQYKEMEASNEDELYVAWKNAGTVLESEETKDVNTISVATSNLKAKWTAQLNNPDSREINLPVQGKFYRLKNVASGRYMNVKNASSVVVTDAGNNLPATIFYLGENNTMLSYSVGQYLDCGNKNLAAVGTSHSGEFAAARSGAKPNTIMYKNNGYWTFGNRANEVSIDRGSGTIAANTVGYDWILEEVTRLPVPMNTTAGYATLYAPVALNNGGRVEAYVGKTEGEWFNMARVDEGDGVIPANTPVVLKYVQDAEVVNNCVYLQVSDFNKDAVVGDENELEGTFADTYFTDAAYALGIVGNEVGFYTAKMAEGKWLNNGFKAYLPKTGVAATLRFNFGGNTTAIESVLNNGVDANAPIYDLSGRRVMNAVKGGIYIQNGKKFIVK